VNTGSIRFRLAAWHAVISSAVFLLLAGLLFFQVRAYLESSIFETQARRARQIAETLVSRAPETGDAYLARQIELLYAPELGDRFIRVTRSDGALLYRSGPPADQGFDPAGVPQQQMGAGADATRVVVTPDGRSLLVASFRTAAPNGQAFVVEVGASGEPVRQLVRHLLELLAIGLPIVLLVSTGGGYVLVRKALEPAEDIAKRAEAITQHSLSERLPVPRTGDELERLSIALNHMITRLDDAFGNSRRFVADASHELRTPLTIVQGELESLAKDMGTPAAFRDRLGALLEDVERLAMIVQRLFALSRLDAGEAQAESVPFNLSSLASGTAEQMRLLAEDKRIALTCDLDRPVFVEGDRSRMTQVVVNLLDNAIKYTQPGGSVNLATREGAGLAVLEVTDTGAGIPGDSLARVFDRFFRVKQDRATLDGGAGLGLAIVKSICSAHGGSVEVESSVGVGSRFRVLLPLCPRPAPSPSPA
jgi:heavy metal sensor kinase